MNKDTMNRRTTVVIDKLMRKGFTRRQAIDMVEKGKESGGKKNG